MKKIFLYLIAIISLITFQSCDKSQANVKTLISNDCGVNWVLIPAGQTIPKRITACELKTTIPSAPMTGESHFKTNFANKVKTNIDMDYEYEIIDPVKFITEAPYLAKTNSDADDVSSNNSRFESAENSIIDKRIKDIARELLENIDIVEFDQSEFEDILQEKVNKSLADRGVHINYLSFVPTPSEQTEQAIDVATAMKIYESKGLQEIGKQVVANKAGAARIEMKVTETNTSSEEVEEVKK
jgi:hypothetical protein